MNKVVAVATGVLLVAGMLWAHGKKAWPVPKEARLRKNSVPATPESIAEGKKLYVSNCFLCHGATGKGDGPWLEKLPERPPDLTDAPMMGEMTDGEIFWKISQGRGQMPNFEKQLDERQCWHLVNYVRTLSKQNSGDPPAKHSH